METNKKYYSDLLKLHGDIESMKKDEENPFFRSNYVPLPKMLKTLKPLYQKHGFILTQPVVTKEINGMIVNVVTSKLTHAETGMFEVSELAITDGLLDEIKKMKLNNEEQMYSTKGDMQKLGGAITYARRYTLSALNSLEEVDDDGNAASNKEVSKPSKSNKNSKRASFNVQQDDF